MIPACSSRPRRSATAGGDSPTRRPSSASDRRASRCSSAIRRRFVESSSMFAATRLKIPSICHVREAARRGMCRFVADRIPPHLFLVVSAVFHYLRPAFAVLLFARVDVLGVAWLRIVSAALVLGLWRRPWRAVAALDEPGRRLLL